MTFGKAPTAQWLQLQDLLIPRDRLRRLSLLRLPEHAHRHAQLIAFCRQLLATERSGKPAVHVIMLVRCNSIIAGPAASRNMP